jgi:hypothetical protein
VILAGHWDEETPVRELAGRGYKVPNGGLFTTVGGLARFEVFEMLSGPESVLSRQELEENAHRIITADRELTGGAASDSPCSIFPATSLLATLEASPAILPSRTFNPPRKLGLSFFAMKAPWEWTS